MNLPRGNVLLKPTSLELEDLRMKLANLQHHGFNGYVRVDAGAGHFYLFMKEGITKSVVEFSGKSLLLISQLLLDHRLRQTTFALASYVLAPELVDVLSCAYAFQEKYPSNYQVRKKEFRKVLGTLDGDKTIGLVEILGGSEDDSTYLLLNQGRIVTDNFLEAYGQIVTGPEKVSDLIEAVSNQGGSVNIYGEKSEQIERKGKLTQEELSRYRELVVAVESGGLRLGGGNAVRVDEGLLREWSRYGAVQKIEVFVPGGAPEPIKVLGKKGLGNKLSIPPSIQKKMGVAKDEPVLVRPG